jgi:hypothetical protein
MMQALVRPEDVPIAALEAVSRVRAGEWSRAEAVDSVYDRAIAGGLVRMYGEDAVQAWLSGAFSMFDDEIVSVTLDQDTSIALDNVELDARAIAQASVPRVTAIDHESFLAMDIQPRAMMLAPWLPMQGLAMIYAPRGTGKTRMAHGIAYAVATGAGFLRWTAPKPRRVLLLDGEMPARSLQEMLRTTTQASAHKPPEPDFFRIAVADLLRDGLPDLADPAAQQFYRDVVADADLVIIDNLSTLCRSLKENDADSWTSVQSWGLSLRRAGKSAVFVHHGGKSGKQRGTSRKEDVLDTIIGLRRPPDYLPEQGARFEVHFEKSRGFHGSDAEAFETRLADDQWVITPIKAGDDLDTILALRKQGLSVRDIAERTGISKSTVARRLGVDDNDKD